MASSAEKFATFCGNSNTKTPAKTKEYYNEETGYRVSAERVEARERYVIAREALKNNSHIWTVFSLIAVEVYAGITWPNNDGLNYFLALVIGFPLMRFAGKLMNRAFIDACFPNNGVDEKFAPSTKIEAAVNWVLFHGGIIGFMMAINWFLNFFVPPVARFNADGSFIYSLSFWITVLFYANSAKNELFEKAMDGLAAAYVEMKGGRLDD